MRSMRTQWREDPGKQGEMERRQRWRRACASKLTRTEIFSERVPEHNKWRSLGHMLESVSTRKKKKTSMFEFDLPKGDTEATTHPATSHLLMQSSPKQRKEADFLATTSSEFS